MNITSLRVSIRALKRNAEKLRKRSSAKAKQQLKRTERKLAKQIAALESAGISPAIKRRKKKKTSSYGGYSQYINSAEWSARREAYFAKHKKQCTTCGAVGSINLHHRTYASLFNEEDEHLVPLCGACHTALHIVQKGFAMTVEEATEIWLSVSPGKFINRFTADAFLERFKQRDMALSPREYLAEEFAIERPFVLC